MISKLLTPVRWIRRLKKLLPGLSADPDLGPKALTRDGATELMTPQPPK